MTSRSGRNLNLPAGQGHPPGHRTPPGLHARISASTPPRADRVARNAVEKDKFNAARRSAILMDLVTKRPDLRPIIFEQVMGKLPRPTPSSDQMNSLMLEGHGSPAASTASSARPPRRTDARNIPARRRTPLARSSAANASRRHQEQGRTSSALPASASSRRRSATTPQLSPDAQLQNKLDAVEAYMTLRREVRPQQKPGTEDALDNRPQLLAQPCARPTKNSDAGQPANTTAPCNTPFSPPSEPASPGPTPQPPREMQVTSRPRSAIRWSKGRQAHRRILAKY